MIGFHSMAQVSKLNKTFGTGWLPPRPDLRDYTEDTPEIASLLQLLKLEGSAQAKKLPGQMDLRSWCSPVEEQGQIGSCTAQAAVGMVEYFERRAHGKHIDGSRRFLYKVTRNLMGASGDSGAYSRHAMGALVLCGVPPEPYWPYTDATTDFDLEPTAFVYAVAEKFEALKYFCHDPFSQSIPPEKILSSVKKYLAAGIPSMFGFYGFSSFEQTDVLGAIPYPAKNEQAQWGHAILAVGYNDAIKIKNKTDNQETTGALLIRNSWGASWGDQGYGWLPYAYVQNRLAMDFWSLLSLSWVDTHQFGF